MKISFAPDYSRNLNLIKWKCRQFAHSPLVLKQSKLTIKSEFISGYKGGREVDAIKLSKCELFNETLDSHFITVSYTTCPLICITYKKRHSNDSICINFISKVQ